MKGSRIGVDGARRVASAVHTKAVGAAAAAGDRIESAADAVQGAAVAASDKVREVTLTPDQKADAFDLTTLALKSRLLYCRVLAQQVNRDGEIDPRELAGLYLLMTTLGLGPAERTAVRKEVGVVPDRLPDPQGLGSDDEAVRLAEELSRVVSAIQRPLVLRRLVRDLMRLAHADRAWRTGEETAPRRIAALFDTPDADKITAAAHAAIEEDERLVERAVSRSRAKSAATGAAAVTAGWAAPAAVYASVLAAANAGGGAAITSTLAMLGFRGILGFTAMSTGIGTLLALGIVSVEGTRYVVRRATGEDLLRRDALRQALLVQHQVAIREMADDLSALALGLTDAMAAAERNASELNRLQRDLRVFAQAVKDLGANERRLATGRTRP